MTYRSSIPLWIRRALSPLTRRILRRPLRLPEHATRRFFSVPHTHNSGCIRINLKGREAYGVVESAQYDTLLAELSRDLLDVRDADSGEPVVERVVLTQQTHPGPAAADLPDMFVVWRREWPFRRITSPKVGVIEIEPMVRTGDHTRHGFFWAPHRSGLDGGVIRPHETASFVTAAAREHRTEELTSA